MKKTLKRILAGISIILASLVIFLFASVLVSGIGGKERVAALTNTTFTNSEGKSVQAYIARPSSPGSFPAVIMIHEFWGLKAEITEKADALAQEGYIVIAPDMFRGSTTSWIPRAIYQVITTPQENLIEDLDIVFNELRDDPQIQIERVGIMGFCFGGRTSLLYSLANNQLAATIVLYGSPETDPAMLSRLSGPVLGIFGGADNSIPLENVGAFEQGLNQAGIPNQITIYEGQPHAFITDMEAIRAGGAPGQAWSEILSFLDQSLKTDSTFRNPAVLDQVSFGQDWGYLAMLVFEHSFIGSAGHHH